MDFETILNILRIGGNSAGALAFLLALWIYFNHQYSMKKKMSEAKKGRQSGN